MNIRQIQEAREHYNIDDWGAGYFSINDSGKVVCDPLGSYDNVSRSIVITDVVEHSKKLGLDTPLIIRFPQIIHTQLKRIHDVFHKSIHEFSYKGKFKAVFPFKVNQRKEFIDNIITQGSEFHYGLEVGSKAECIAAMSYNLSPEALFIMNGFKDKEFLELGFIAAGMGKNVIVVIESPEELVSFLSIMPEYQTHPSLALRIKLYSRGSGKWEKSSGEASKFGLTTNELVFCLDQLKESKHTPKLKMVHFHIGSQITEIKRIKNAIKEAARVYCKISKQGFDLDFIDIGGGIGVDYDGSKTSFESSANYSLQEFANDVVYTLKDVCKEEKVKVPTVISEGGRVVAAYHSVVVTDIREIQSPNPQEQSIKEIFPTLDEKNCPRALSELYYIHGNINQKNYGEYYHDALEHFEELFTLFNLGQVNLEQRAAGEELYKRICRSAVFYSSAAKHQPEEFSLLQKEMVSKYLANFSIFQSIPDAWSIDQLFPVLPLSHHDIKPDHKATIIDITCDSDGCIDRFIDRRGVKSELELHQLGGSHNQYYLGFFLVGAYQESLSNEHNLFGAINEVEVIMNPETTKWEIIKTTEGDSIAELLEIRNYNIKELKKNAKQVLEKQWIEEKITEDQYNKSVVNYEKMLESLPYLIVDPKTNKKRKDIIELFSKKANLTLLRSSQLSGSHLEQ